MTLGVLWALTFLGEAVGVSSVGTEKRWLRLSVESGCVPRVPACDSATELVSDRCFDVNVSIPSDTYNTLL